MFYAFNRGLISRLALARDDLQRYRLSAETMVNWMPRVLGSMMLRPGTKYIDSTRNDAEARLIPFVFSSSDTAILELTSNVLRVWVDDVLIARPTVTSAVSNGDFDANLTGWTDADEAGGTSVWATGGYMSLTGSGFDAAIRRQEITVTAGSDNVEHGLRVVINRGPCVFKCGSSAGDDDYISETKLGVGTHSLSFTPTGNFHLEFSNRLDRAVYVDSVQVESSGVMELPTVWTDLDLVRKDSSGDITYLACEGCKPQKIERRSARSWSVVDYAPEDGPYRVENVDPINLTPSAASGDIRP